MDALTLETELESMASQRLEGYRQLIALAEEQRDILISGRHSELEGNVASHEPVIMDFSQVDRKESAFLTRLEHTEPGILSSEDFKRLYRAANEEPLRAAERLRALTQTNKEMLSNAVSYLSYTAGVLCRLATDQQAYDPNLSNAASAAVVFDMKV